MLLMNDYRTLELLFPLQLSRHTPLVLVKSNISLLDTTSPLTSNYENSLTR